LRTSISFYEADDVKERHASATADGTHVIKVHASNPLPLSAQGVALEAGQTGCRNSSAESAASALNKPHHAPQPADHDTRGYVWVSDKGETLGPVSEQKFETKPPAVDPLSGLTTEKQIFMASLSPVDRSTNIWRRVNPGCMETSCKLPKSTYNSHFVGESLAEPLDKSRYRMKTDFTAYADEFIRSRPH
jgi:hypothetical protein